MKNPIAKVQRELRCLETAQLVLAGACLLGGIVITTVLVVRGMRTEPVPMFIIVGLVIGGSLTCTGFFGGLLLGRRRDRRGQGTKDAEQTQSASVVTGAARQGAPWRSRVPPGARACGSTPRRARATRLRRRAEPPAKR